MRFWEWCSAMAFANAKAFNTGTRHVVKQVDYLWEVTPV